MVSARAARRSSSWSAADLEQVLDLLVEGLGHRAIAQRLHVSANTVRTHSQNLQKKLNVHSALAAVAGGLVALMNNLVDPAIGFIVSYKALAIIVLGVTKVALLDPLASNWGLIAAPRTIAFSLLVVVLLGSGALVSAVGSGLSLRRFLRV